MSDVIEIRGLRTVTVIGVLDEERERAQPISIDLDIEVDASLAAASDDLEFTVNYAELAELAVACVQTRAPQLLETACDEIARRLLEHDGRVLAVGVVVTKLRPPVPLDLDTVGVRRRVTR